MNEKRYVVWRVGDITNRCYTQADAEKEAIKAVKNGEETNCKSAYVLEVLSVAQRAEPPVELRVF